MNGKAVGQLARRKIGRPRMGLYLADRDDGGNQKQFLIAVEKSDFVLAQIIHAVRTKQAWLLGGHWPPGIRQA